MQISRVTGSLQIKNNKYYAVVGWYENGKRTQKWYPTNLFISGNKRKAQSILNQYIGDKERDLQMPKSDMLFSDLLRLWLHSRKSQLAPNTYENYSLVVHNKIIPFFFERKTTLCNLEADDLMAYYNQMIQNGKSVNTVRHHHAYIHAALSYAVKKNLIYHNPADTVELNKKEKPQTAFYNADELTALLQIAKHSSIETPVLLACYLGLRRSEVLGLQWEDIDFQNNTITIRKKVCQYHDEQGQLLTVATNKLKNESSRRTLAMTKPVREHLSNLQIQQQQKILKLGHIYKQAAAGFVCVRENGSLMKPDYLTRHFKSLLQQNDMKIIRFHDLRHSFASLLVSNNISLKMVQNCLGHADFNTTANIYTHITKDDQLKAFEMIADKITFK